MKNFYRYLPLSDEVRGRSLYVLAAGCTTVAAHSPYPSLPHPADHDFYWCEGRTLQEYQVIYITRGQGIFESKSGGTRLIKAGTLFMLFPGEWHRYSPDKNTGWDEHWVAFQGRYADEFVAEHPLSAAEPVLEVGINENLIEEYASIIDEIRNEALGYQQIIAARTLLILSLLTASTLRRSFEGTEISRVIEKAKGLLLQQIDQPVNIEKMALDLGVGYSWFRRMFRQYTGLSPAQYHLQLRINRACELLRATKLPVATIGHSVGCESAYYFSRIFKDKTGYSPRDYRAISQAPLNSDESISFVQGTGT